jgi:molybdate transport system substrate-binding protein
VKHRVAVAGLALALVAATCVGCGGGGGGGGTSGTLTVLAAASLTESFTELGRTFEAAHTGIEVTFNFAGSTALARQLAEGAPGDVLATADEPSMQAAVDAGTVGDPVVFARNRLEIVVAKGNPKGIRTPADLARPGVVFVLCAPEVPCGRSAAQVLQRSGVTVEAASLEENVKAVLSRVTLGEADAGIVYVTDVRAARPSVEGVPIPDEANVVVDYPIASAARAGNPDAARTWVDLVLSPEGRRILADFGFVAP